MGKLNTFTMHASKVIEIFFIVVSVLMIISIIAVSAAVVWANGKIRENNIDVVSEAQKLVEENSDIRLSEDAYKLIGEGLEEEHLLRKDKTVNLAVIIVTMVYALINCAAFTMIFRNINLILKTARGKTWFSEGETPFQKDITRMIREIGIFLLLTAAIGFIMSLFVSTVTVQLVYVVIGILMLCLSSFFSYGEQLQKETDGLV